ncbi:TPA: hypothetical protein ACNAEZ_001776 [Citrobacter farmeri]
MARTTVMAYFSIYGEKFDTEDVTVRLDISPTETKVKGVIPEGKNGQVLKLVGKFALRRRFH